ncbi:hypothetical protein L9F63_008726, partial [Diploptera punctata]
KSCRQIQYLFTEVTFCNCEEITRHKTIHLTLSSRSDVLDKAARFQSTSVTISSHRVELKIYKICKPSYWNLSENLEESLKCLIKIFLYLKIIRVILLKIWNIANKSNSNENSALQKQIMVKHLLAKESYILKWTPKRPFAWRRRHLFTITYEKKTRTKFPSKQVKKQTAKSEKKVTNIKNSNLRESDDFENMTLAELKKKQTTEHSDKEKCHISKRLKKNKVDSIIEEENRDKDFRTLKKLFTSAETEKSKRNVNELSKGTQEKVIASKESLRRESERKRINKPQKNNTSKKLMKNNLESVRDQERNSFYGNSEKRNDDSECKSRDIDSYSSCNKTRRKQQHQHRQKDKKTSAEDVDLLDAVSSQTAEFTEHNANFELTTSTPWIVEKSHKKKQEYFKPFFKEIQNIIENNFKDNYARGHNRRQEVINGYHEEEESEFKKLERNIQHWEKQEDRLRKLDKYVRYVFSLQSNYADDFTQSKTKLQSVQQCFRRDCKKVDREQRKLSKTSNEDLKKELDDLVTKRIYEESTNEVQKLRSKMSAILGFLEEK